LPIDSEARKKHNCNAKGFSLSRRQAWIGAFLVVAHFLFAFSLNPAGFSSAFAASGAC
jgi:uncharacterized membrane protein